MNNFNLKYLVIAVITLSVLIMAGAVIFTLLKKPITKSTLPPKPASITATPSAALNKVIEGKLKDLTKDRITLESTKSGQLSFNLIATTIYYQCTDFNNINKCKISKDNLKTGSLIRVFAKSEEVLYVLYK